MFRDFLCIPKAIIKCYNGACDSTKIFTFGFDYKFWTAIGCRLLNVFKHYWLFGARHNDN